MDVAGNERAIDGVVDAEFLVGLGVDILGDQVSLLLEWWVTVDIPHC